MRVKNTDHVMASRFVICNAHGACLGVAPQRHGEWKTENTMHPSWMRQGTSLSSRHDIITIPPYFILFFIFFAKARMRRKQADHNPNRFGHSNLHQRDPRSALFEGYNPPDGSTGPNGRQQASASPNRYGSYGYAANGGGGGAGTPGSLGPGTPSGGYRPATPNRKGQYSDAVLNELESQNDSHVEGILGKVKILKDVGFFGRDFFWL
jgi:hypothetical protein